MRDDAARALRVDDDDLLDRPYERRFERSSARSAGASRRFERAVVPRERETVPRERARAAAAPARAYGSRRRSDAPGQRVTGAQPGRRTVEITGQAAPPRRRSQTQSAFVARPDRTALWAFLFALFLLVMAVATAHG